MEGEVVTGERQKEGFDESGTSGRKEERGRREGGREGGGGEPTSNVGGKHYFLGIGGRRTAEDERLIVAAQSAVKG